MIQIKQSRGFSLVELLVAMVVGLIIVTGVFALHSTTRKTQVLNETHMDMVADARFAIELLSYDLRHAGIWGGNNKEGNIDCRTERPCTAADKPAAPTGDCAVGWAYDLNHPITGIDDSTGANPYANTCISLSEKHKTGTDIIGIRYADSNYLDAYTGSVKALASGQAYIRSNFECGTLFVGTTEPVLKCSDNAGQNYVFNAYAYYISNYTDKVGDGIPSLRRAALANGPEMKNQLLVSGVVDMQILYGEDVDQVKDANGNFSVDQYVPANAVSDMAHVIAVKIWMLMRSDNKQQGFDTTKSFSLAGKAAQSYGGQDGFQHFLVSSVVNLRNRNGKY